MKKQIAKPFVKWAGGKGQLLNEIKKRYPKELGLGITKYAEPFVGGGAVLFDILSTYTLSEIYISDTNAQLINTYTTIRDSVDSLISLLTKYQNEYLPLDDENRKKYYYDKRTLYNFMSSQNKLDYEMAAIFIFLNKTGFNGLYRVNSKGEYNVPIGSYKNPTICDKDNLLNASLLLKNVTIVCADYKKSDSFIDDKTFVYFDPPYRPLNNTSSFTGYTNDGFDDKAQKELADFSQKITRSGAFVVISNSDPKNTNPEDDFFDGLYSKMKISRVSASRMINSNANSRGKISELIIRSY